MPTKEKCHLKDCQGEVSKPRRIPITFSGFSFHADYDGRWCCADCFEKETVKKIFSKSNGFFRCFGVHQGKLLINWEECFSVIAHDYADDHYDRWGELLGIMLRNFGILSLSPCGNYEFSPDGLNKLFYWSGDERLYFVNKLDAKDILRAYSLFQCFGDDTSRNILNHHICHVKYDIRRCLKTE